MSIHIDSDIRADFKITFEINEVEAAALHDMVAYGTQSFLDVFYEKLGKAYMRKHESGLRSVFDTIRNELPSKISSVKKAKKAIEKIKKGLK